MKKALMITTAVLFGILGILITITGLVPVGLILIGLAIFIIKVAFAPVDKDGKPIFYNPNSTKNSLVINSALQIFESLNIIVDTKTFKTMQSRINYVQSRYNYFLESSTDPAYQRNIETAVNLYNKQRKSLTNDQIEVLLKPSKQILDAFLGSCILYKYGEYVKKEVVEIDTLIRENVIKNRKIKMIETGNAYTQLFYLMNIEDIENKCTNAIEEIQTALKQK
jgi:hypothetical protein